MIVVDASVVVYLLLPHPTFTAHADRVLDAEPAWSAPPLWRSEVRNALLQHIRHQDLALEQAVRIMGAAEDVLGAHTLDVASQDVMALAEQSGCTACDCEYVASAKHLGGPLVTTDRQVLSAFPETAVRLRDFAS